MKDTPGAAERPYAFILGPGGSLWVNWWTGSQWKWSDQGVPATGKTGIGTIGVATVKDNPNAAERPYAFVQGSDNHLWVNWWTGSQWNWSDQGIPAAGKTVSGTIGVVTVKDNPNAAERPYAFVQGSDNHLWVNWWTGSQWNWSDQGVPAAGKTVSRTIGVVTVKDNPNAPERPYAFVQGSDNHLWINWWTGSQWNWSDQGVPAAGKTVSRTIGVITVKDNPNAPERPYAFVQGSDNHLWINWWTGSQWNWSDQGIPAAGKTVSGTIGVVTVKDNPNAAERPYAFVQGSDNHLWVNWWTGNQWKWSDQGVPGGNNVGGPLGVVTVKDNPNAAERPYAFVFNLDGAVWVNWWNGNAWLWADQAKPTLVVDMIPAVLGGETNQDSEPFLSVHPSSHNILIGSAFTPNPNGTASGTAPIYISTDCGRSWSLNNIVPSAAPLTGTGDITHAYNGSGARFYSGIIRLPGAINITELEAADPTTAVTMTIQNSRLQVDQPFVQSTTVGASDRIYVGNNDFNALPRTATVDVSLNDGANYNSVRLDPRNTTSPQDGPSIRVSMAKNNTVYAAYFQWTNFNGSMATSNVVVVRDDNGATGPNPFTALVGPGGQSGVFAAAGVQIPWSNAPTLGQERIGSTLSLAVDPNNSSNVYVAWGDRLGNGDIYTIHVRHSTDKGVTWSQDLAPRTNATDCSLAVAENGTVGFLYQQVTNGRWVTHLEQTKNAFASVTDTVLATVPSNSPPLKFLPYIGDYNFLLPVGSEFRGIFSANNTPDSANFPQGVRYQRKADFTTHKLLDGNGNQVPISIDPFYFSLPVLH